MVLGDDGSSAMNVTNPGATSSVLHDCAASTLFKTFPHAPAYIVDEEAGENNNWRAPPQPVGATALHCWPVPLLRSLPSLTATYTASAFCGSTARVVG